MIMEQKEVWNFECPQFVDFEKELDKTGEDDIFFDSKDKNQENGSLCTPEVQGKGKGLTESDENRLLGKMTAALSLLENTPKILKSAPRRKLYPDRNYKQMNSKIIKSTIKVNTVPAPHPRSRMSKSLDHLNKIISGKTHKQKKNGLRKSSSLNDLRTHNRLKYPITPMCLKRTIFKAKEKIVKTTEEMELEQIAILQKQLIQHLRQNEISLKRLNLRPRPCVVSKTLPKSLNGIKGENTHAEKSNVTENKPRRYIHTQVAGKQEASKLDTTNNDISSKKTENTIYSRKSRVLSVPTVNSNVNILKPNLPVERAEASKIDTTVNHEASSSKKTNTIYSRKAKTLSVCAVDSDVNKNSTQQTRKKTYKRIMDHSGLMFVPSIKNNAVVKPFMFEERIKEMKQLTAGAKQKEISSLNSKENSNKENSGCVKSHLTKKTQGIQNIKDTSKLAESNKIIGKKTANPARGTPLAENIVRD